jgi:hypothetical protein
MTPVPIAVARDRPVTHGGDIEMVCQGQHQHLADHDGEAGPEAGVSSVAERAVLVAIEMPVRESTRVK